MGIVCVDLDEACATKSKDQENEVCYDMVKKPVDVVQLLTNKEDGEAEPPKKKKRFRGTNKKRPRDEKQLQQEQLCPSVVHGDPSQCFYGSSCKFSHDIKGYMAVKSVDLGPKCPNFERLGLCSYGVTCRFASAHLGDDFQNIVNEELYQSLPQPQTCNQLLFDLKSQLRKRQVPSPRTDKYLKRLNDLKKHTYSVKNVEETTCADSVALANVSLETEGLGCVTDEDQIRLQPSEKRKFDCRNKLFLAPLTTVGGCSNENYHLCLYLL